LIEESPIGDEHDIISPETALLSLIKVYSSDLLCLAIFRSKLGFVISKLDISPCELLNS